MVRKYFNNLISLWKYFHSEIVLHKFGLGYEERLKMFIPSYIQTINFNGKKYNDYTDTFILYSDAVNSLECIKKEQIAHRRNNHRGPGASKKMKKTLDVRKKNRLPFKVNGNINYPNLI